MEEEKQRGGEPEHIGKILQRVTGTEGSSQSNQGQTSPTTERKTEPCECAHCGTAFQGEVTYYLKYPQRKPWRPTECPKCQAEREAEKARLEEEEREKKRQELRARWRWECGMPAELLTRTFDNFEKKYQKKAFKVALDWAKNFDLDAPHGYPSLIFYSDVPGVGKGHLMSAIVNLLIDNGKGESSSRRCPIRFESGPSLVRRIRATYNLRKEDDYHEREDEVYAKLAGVALLLLDDVGKETPSNFTRETYWYIIDERVKTSLPVIISSRLTFEGDHSLVELMGEDTVSRLYGMAQGQFIEMTGQDYRRLKAIA